MHFATEPGAAMQSTTAGDCVMRTIFIGQRRTAHRNSRQSAGSRLCHSRSPRGCCALNDAKAFETF